MKMVVEDEEIEDIIEFGLRYYQWDLSDKIKL